MKLNAKTTQVQPTHHVVDANKNIAQEEISANHLNNQISAEEAIEIQALERTKSNLTNQELDMQFHDESGLIQSIIKERFSEEVIRKMPSDEYLSLLRLVGEYIDGLIDKEV